MKKIQIMVGGEEWIVRLLTHREYIKKHGDDSIGITEPLTKTITFDKSNLVKSTIAHELLHVYFSFTLITDCSLSQDDMEELACNVLGKYIDEYYKVYIYLVDQLGVKNEIKL